MVWGGFSSKEKTNLVFIETSINASSYISLLNRKLLPFGSELHLNEYIFQQDNAPCHTANKTKDWFDQKGVICMDWSSLSPDLNPIENVWGMMARLVYADGKQSNNLDELKQKIINVWDELNPEYLQKLINSINDRMFKVDET